MAVLNLPWERCWCFRTVRTGSIASAIYAVVCSLFRLTSAIVEEVLVEDGLKDNMTMTELQAYKMEKTMGYIEVVVAILLLAAGICVLIGIYRHIAGLLIPFIIMFMLTVGLEVILALMVLLLLVLGVNFVAVLILLAVVLFFLFVDTSCLLCVTSHYLNLRAGREPMRAVYRREGEMMTTEGEDDHFQPQAGAGALPTKTGPPGDSSFNYSGMSDLPVGSGGEAPPPYRDIA